MSSGLLHNYLIVGAILFCLGAIGFLTRRNLIIMFLSAEMMLQGVALNLVAFGAHHRALAGQAFVIFMLTVAACEAVLALALILCLYRRGRTLDVSVWQILREANQEAVVDEGALPPMPTPALNFPTLPPSGVRPVSVGEETTHG
jgi:NADH-quinone oxidoreductase subunit K